MDEEHTKRQSRKVYHEATPRTVPAVVAVYVVLGMLVLGMSFYTGYLTGQNQILKAGTNQQVGGVPAPTPTIPNNPVAAPSPQQPSVRADVAEGRYIIGDKDAQVTLVEFADYQCPFCKRYFDQTEQQVIDQYVKTGKVRYSVRHFPLSFHQNAQKASEAVECAGQQDKFWKMHKILFQNSQADGTGLNTPDLKKYAADIGLDAGTFNQCLDSGATTAIVQKDFQEGSAVGVSGTPSFFINGQQLVGAQPFSSFQQAIDAALQQ
jgi:protein-disulfide isomerase